MEVKLREIVRGKRQSTQGFTVPQEIAIFFSGCFFHVRKVDNSIIFESGTSIKPTESDIDSYKFEDCRIIE